LINADGDRPVFAHTNYRETPISVFKAMNV
jgi:hypothetical protein